MATTITPISHAPSSPSSSCAKTTPPPSSATPVAAPDRVGLSPSTSAALLTGGAIVAAQLVPGVVEGEVATGAVTAIGVGLRAATSTGIGKFAASTLSSAVGGYGLSLLKDAAGGQATMKGASDAVGKANVLVHDLLSIPLQTSDEK